MFRVKTYHVCILLSNVNSWGTGLKVIWELFVWYLEFSISLKLLQNKVLNKKNQGPLFRKESPDTEREPVVPAGEATQHSILLYLHYLSCLCSALQL